MQNDRPPINGGLILVLLLVFRLSALHAADIKTGVHGMDWASPITDHDHLTRVRVAGPASYYVDRNMTYQTANQPVPGVVYGYFQDRFFAVYIKLRSQDQAYYLQKHFRTAYGPAKVSKGHAGDQTIYRWKNDDLKIKLKVNENTAEIKLGIYYRPLSSQLNQMRVEELPPDTFHSAPADDAATELEPLL